MRPMLLLGFVALALAPALHAVPTLRLSDGATTVSITDDTASDQDYLSDPGFQHTAGIVNFTGSVGSWTLNITTGVSKPAAGSAISPVMTLNSVNASSSAGGTLTISFSDDFFGPTTANMLANLGVSFTSGTVSYTTYSDSANALFGMTTGLTSVGPLGPGSFNTSSTTSLALPSPYSLTMQVVIAHAANGTTSLAAGFQEGAAVPDGGSAVFLLGLSLVALAAQRRNMICALS